MAKLYFYYSAMNAGKSTTLLQSSYNYIERGMQTLLFAAVFDDRYGEDTAVTSRIGMSQKAIPYDNDFDFFEYVNAKKTEMSKLKCILVDEAHFLKKHHVAQFIKITTELNIPVLTYGLRSNFLGEPFESSKYLLAWADELIEIKTICHCGRKATMNLRMDASGNPLLEGESIQVGGNESYTSLCMKHFRELVPPMEEYTKVTVEAAQ